MGSVRSQVRLLSLRQLQKGKFMAATLEKTPGLHLAVSTGSFLDFSRGKDIAKGALARKPDLHELERTYRVAEQLGIGVEVAYRVLGTDAIKAVSAEANAPTVSVHMPIFANRMRFLGHRFAFPGVVTNYAGSELGLGFAHSSWGGIQELAVAHPEAVFVAHPDLALWLNERLAVNEPFRARVGVETDWPSVPNSPRLITDTARVIEIIDTSGFVANPDTSHNSLTHNPPVDRIAESLNAMVDAYGFGRLHRIHFSANTPYPEGTSPAQWPGGSLPLNSNLITAEHLRQYHEWYKETDRKAKAWRRAVYVPIEIYGWNGPSADRERGVEATMNGLIRGKLDGDSRSYPNRPTVTLQS